MDSQLPAPKENEASFFKMHTLDLKFDTGYFKWDTSDVTLK
jgi:hypothetical protein